MTLNLKGARPRKVATFETEGVAVTLNLKGARLQGQLLNTRKNDKWAKLMGKLCKPEAQNEGQKVTKRPFKPDLWTNFPQAWIAGGV